MSLFNAADGIRCIRRKAENGYFDVIHRTVCEVPVSVEHTYCLGVIGRSHYEIYIIQPDQSSCECMTMPLGSVSLGSVKNVSVNAKTRTKCIIFFFGLNQNNQENRITSPIY